jgi:hypothetical protein
MNPRHTRFRTLSGILAPVSHEANYASSDATATGYTDWGGRTRTCNFLINSKDAAAESTEVRAFYGQLPRDTRATECDSAPLAPTQHTHSAASTHGSSHYESPTVLRDTFGSLAASHYSWQASSGWCVALLLLLGAGR